MSPIYSARQSAEESREHLLRHAAPPPSSLTRSGRPASIAPSIASVLSDASTIAAPQTTHRGFPSREAYLSALEDFVESKMYLETGHTLIGFYGKETMDDIITKLPDQEFRWQRRRKEKKEHAKARRMPGATRMDSVSEEMHTVPEGSDTRGTRSGTDEEVGEQVERTETNVSQKEGRMRRLSRVFSGGRRATVA